MVALARKRDRQFRLMCLTAKAIMAGMDLVSRQFLEFDDEARGRLRTRADIIEQRTRKMLSAIERY
jgi:hypothetical protein